MSRFLRHLVFIFLTPLLLSGCGSFQQAWKKAASPSPPAADVLLGAWEGSWTSGSTKHTGALRLIVTKLAPAKQNKEGNLYDFRYHARWGKLLSGQFRLTCPAVRQNGAVLVQGGMDLGPLLGGAFQHTGTIKHGRLEANYDSAMDSGTFSLQRLGSLPSSTR